LKNKDKQIALMSQELSEMKDDFRKAEIQLEENETLHQSNYQLKEELTDMTKRFLEINNFLLEIEKQRKHMCKNERNLEIDQRTQVQINNSIVTENTKLLENIRDNLLIKNRGKKSKVNSRAKPRRKYSQSKQAEGGARYSDSSPGPENSENRVLFQEEIEKYTIFLADKLSNLNNESVELILGRFESVSNFIKIFEVQKYDAALLICLKILCDLIISKSQNLSCSTFQDTRERFSHLQNMNSSSGSKPQHLFTPETERIEKEFSTEASFEKCRKDFQEHQGTNMPFTFNPHSSPSSRTQSSSSNSNTQKSTNAKSKASKPSQAYPKAQYEGKRGTQSLTNSPDRSSSGMCEIAEQPDEESPRHQHINRKGLYLSKSKRNQIERNTSQHSSVYGSKKEKEGRNKHMSNRKIVSVSSPIGNTKMQTYSHGQYRQLKKYVDQHPCSPSNIVKLSSTLASQQRRKASPFKGHQYQQANQNYSKVSPKGNTHHNHSQSASYHSFKNNNLNINVNVPKTPETYKQGQNRMDLQTFSASPVNNSELQQVFEGVVSPNSITNSAYKQMFNRYTKNRTDYFDPFIQYGGKSL
jgi:hypothetical protein